MFVAAALVPDTALLVPGAGGAADPGASLREAALTAVGELVGAVGAEGGRAIWVVAPGPREREVVGAARASVAAAGVPDELSGWPPIGPAGAPVAGVPASVGLLLLARHGVRAGGFVELPAIASGGASVAAHAHGGLLVDRGVSGLVVVGSASGRHGPDAPLADDRRAPAYDDAVLADLVDASPSARLRLRALDPGSAVELAVTGWAPWQALVAAAGDAPVTARLLRREVLAGATHAVLTWRVAG